MKLQALKHNQIFDKLRKVVGRTSSAIDPSSMPTRITCAPWSGPKLPIGAKIRIDGKGTWLSVVATLTGTLTTNQTTFNVTFQQTPLGILPTDSPIVIDEVGYHQRKFKSYFVEHIHLFETGSTHGNDLLINSQEPGGGKYNHNAGTTLSDGSAYSNNWGTKFSVMNVPDYNCILERVIVRASSNGTTNEDWRLTLWEKPVNNNAATSSQISLINTYDFISQGNASYVHHFDDNIEYELGSGNAIIPSFRKTGTKQTSSTKHYADITLIFSFLQP